MKTKIVAAMFILCLCVYGKSDLDKVLNKYADMPGIEEIKTLLDKGINARLREQIEIGDYVFEIGDTPLMMSLWYGYKDLSKYLIKNKADIFAINSLWQGALHYAAAGSDGEMINMLIKKGIKTDSKCQDGQTPIMLAAFYGNEDAVRTLIKHKADVNHIDNLNQSILLGAAVCGNTNIINMLIENNADVLFKGNENFQTPLIIASSYGNIDAVKIFLKYTSDIDYRDNLGRNALIYAISYEYKEVIKLLLENNADINLKYNGDGSAPIMYTAQSKNAEFINFLIENGAEIDIIGNENQQTPLMMASFYGNAEILETFLSHSGNINHKDRIGRTALIYALADNKSKDMIDLLIKNNADINETDEYGNSALIYSLIYYDGNIEVVKLLFENNADVNIVNKEGDNALNILEQVKSRMSEEEYEEIKNMIEDLKD